MYPSILYVLLWLKIVYKSYQLLRIFIKTVKSIQFVLFSTNSHINKPVSNGLWETSNFWVTRGEVWFIRVTVMAARDCFTHAIDWLMSILVVVIITNIEVCWTLHTAVDSLFINIILLFPTTSKLIRNPNTIIVNFDLIHTHYKPTRFSWRKPCMVTYIYNSVWLTK